MHSRTLLALSAFGAVHIQGSPLLARQASSVVSAVPSAASSAISAVSSAAVAVPSSAASAVSSITSVMVTTPMVSSSSMSSIAPTIATSTGANMTGGQVYSAYPCPAGTLLTYVTVNETFPVPLANLTMAAGEFATSPLFGNVTMGMNGNNVGATHVLNIPTTNISIPETLVNVTTNATSGHVMWTWNSTAPATAMGLTLATYQTVLSLYDGNFSTTGMKGNTSTALLYTNACLSNQTEGMVLLRNLGGLELANLAAALTGGSMMNGTVTTAAAPTSTMMMASTSLATSPAAASTTTTA